MAEVFISYARANEGIVRRVANGLKATGLDVWFDEDLPAHRAYSDIIEQKLQSADAVVVLWSKEAAQSQWVRAEADYARNAGKLVQARLDDALPPLPFNQIQCADIRGWRGHRKHRGWGKLAASVASVVAGEAAQPAEPASASGRSRFERRHAIAALAALLILVAGIIYLLPRLAGGGDGDIPRVAVLPFESVGGSDAGLVAGIWEDTRQALSRNPQLVVLGPNSSEEIAKGGSGAARKAADYLVEASVRTADDRVRVSTSLVRSKDGAQIWSQTFDRKLDDVFALQSEIAQQIEGRIRGRLARGGGVLPEHITTSGEVYMLYSDARAKIRGRQIGRYEEALEQLQKVVAMDPNFAPGWATLSVAASMQVAGVSAEHVSRSEAYARRAIALAPNLAAGHAALGFALGHGPAAEAALRRAVALDPNDIEALNWLANALDPQSRGAEKFSLYSQIVEVEPLWWPAILNKLGILLGAQDYAAAERERERLERLGATVIAGMVGIAIEDAKGDLSEAAKIGIRTFNAAEADERGFLGFELVFVLLKLGHFDVVQSGFSELVPPVAPYLWRNDPRGLDMLEAMNLDPRQFFMMGPLTASASRVYLLSGRSERLAELYRSGSSPQELAPDVAPVVAMALRRAGDAAAADRLLASAEARLRRGPNFPPRTRQALLARIYAVQGRRDDALRRLTEAVDAGWVPDPPFVMTDIAGDPPLALLKGDPRFEAARRKIMDYINKERAELGPVDLRSDSPVRRAA